MTAHRTRRFVEVPRATPDFAVLSPQEQRMNSPAFTDGTVYLIEPATQRRPDQNSLPIPRGRQYAIRESVSLELDAARDLWQRMEALPQAEQMRCHTPKYALGLRSGDSVEWLATLCWQCNNIFLQRHGVDDTQTFDGKSAAARDLLRSFDDLFDADHTA